MASREEIAALITVLTSAARVELDGPLLEAYSLVLADVEPNTLRDAVLAAVKIDSPWLRKPGELLADCEKLRTRGITYAIKAWDEYVLFGRGDAMAEHIARQLQVPPHTDEFYTDGRRYFLDEYTRRLRVHDGDLDAAIEHSRQLTIGESK